MQAARFESLPTKKTQACVATTKCFVFIANHSYMKSAFKQAVSMTETLDIILQTSFFDKKREKNFMFRKSIFVQWKTLAR